MKLHWETFCVTSVTMDPRERGLPLCPCCVCRSSPHPYITALENRADCWPALLIEMDDFIRRAADRQARPRQRPWTHLPTAPHFTAWIFKAICKDRTLPYNSLVHCQQIMCCNWSITGQECAYFAGYEGVLDCWKCWPKVLYILSKKNKCNNHCVLL